MPYFLVPEERKKVINNDLFGKERNLTIVSDTVGLIAGNPPKSELAYLTIAVVCHKLYYAHYVIK